MNLPPLPLPPLPLLPPPHAEWLLEMRGYDCAFLKIEGMLTRVEVFRLVGELERLGSRL